jgi:hypothetical protein
VPWNRNLRELWVSAVPDSQCSLRLLKLLKLKPKLLKLKQFTFQRAPWVQKKIQHWLCSYTGCCPVLQACVKWGLVYDMKHMLGYFIFAFAFTFCKLATGLLGSYELDKQLQHGCSRAVSPCTLHSCSIIVHSDSLLIIVRQIDHSCIIIHLTAQKLSWALIQALRAQVWKSSHVGQDKRWLLQRVQRGSISSSWRMISPAIIRRRARVVEWRWCKHLS